MNSDPSAGQPRESGAYAARPSRTPEPTVTLRPGFQGVRFPSGHDHVLSPSSAHDLCEGFWASNEANRWTVASFARLDSPVGTIVRVVYTGRRFIVSFSTGGGPPTNEYLTAEEGKALRFTLVEQFPEPWDDNDFDEDDDE